MRTEYINGSAGQRENEIQVNVKNAVKNGKTTATMLALSSMTAHYQQ